MVGELLLNVKVKAVDRVVRVAVIEGTGARVAGFEGAESLPQEVGKLSALGVRGDGVVVNGRKHATNGQDDLDAELLARSEAIGDGRAVVQELRVGVETSKAVVGEVVTGEAGLATVLGRDVDESQGHVVDAGGAHLSQVVVAGLPVVDVDLGRLGSHDGSSGRSQKSALDRRHCGVC